MLSGSWGWVKREQKSQDPSGQRERRISEHINPWLQVKWPQMLMKVHSGRVRVSLSPHPSEGTAHGITAALSPCQAFVAAPVLMVHRQKLSSLVLVFFNFSVNFVLPHRMRHLDSGVQLHLKVLRNK